jgi:phenylpyruvate tautomerase PptA (4-oxalocrotonate tautomerase family)
MPMIDVTAAAGTFGDRPALRRSSPRREMTEIVAAAVGDPTVADRTWVLISESPDGGWGINGHAYLNSEIADTARKILAGG